MYYASLFVKHFSIDDVYFGILAKKLEIVPVQNGHFYAWYPKNEIQIDDEQFSETIAMHGCKCTSQMTDLWINRNPQKLLQC